MPRDDTSFVEGFFFFSYDFGFESIIVMLSDDFPQVLDFSQGWWSTFWSLRTQVVGDSRLFAEPMQQPLARIDKIPGHFLCLMSTLRIDARYSKSKTVLVKPSRS